jgi:hypothetical protein
MSRMLLIFAIVLSFLPLLLRVAVRPNPDKSKLIRASLAEHAEAAELNQNLRSWS